MLAQRGKTGEATPQPQNPTHCVGSLERWLVIPIRVYGGTMNKRDFLYFVATLIAALPCACPSTLLNRPCGLTSPPSRPCVPITTPPCLNRGLNGLRGLPHTSLPPLHRSHPPSTYPPDPLSYKERGSTWLFDGFTSSYSDGFERMDHAIETQPPSRNPSQNPSPFPLPRRHRRSLQ